MNAPELLSPALLHATAVCILALTVLQVAAYTGLIALVARRTALSPRAQILVPLLTGALFAAWLGWAVLAVREPVVAPEPPSTGGPNIELLLKMGIFFSLGVVALFSSRTLRTLYAATPPAWLIGVQIYRVAGVMFLWPFLASGALSLPFALVAGLGDLAVGLAAPFVVWSLARQHPRAYGRAIAWNYFGIFDFAVAVTVAVLSKSTNIGHFPLVIVQVFIVPVGILAHLYSLRSLAATRDLPPERNPARWPAALA